MIAKFNTSPVRWVGLVAGKQTAFLLTAALFVYAPAMTSVAVEAPTLIVKSAGRESMADLDDKHALAIGDQICFRILEDNDAPKELVVTDSGEVEVPYLGRVAVKGTTSKQLALALKKEFEAKYYYHATVIIALDAMSRDLGMVYISGALRTPGRLGIPGNEVFTLSKAVLCAGGFSEGADKHHIKVTRRAESSATNETFTVDVGLVLEKGKTELDLPLKPGDMIFVPERLAIF